MLPAIANFFQVTTDELLGVDITKANEKIKEYEDAIKKLQSEWNLVNAEDTSLRPEDRIRLLDELLSLQKIVFGDNLGENFMYSVMYSYEKAKLYCRLNDTQKALDNLEEAVTYAGLYEEYDENSTFFSEMLKQHEVLPHSYWSQSAFADLYDELFEGGKDKYLLLQGNKRFDSICATVCHKSISNYG